MVRYTQNGSEKLHAQIAQDLERVAEKVSPYAQAGVLLGGYGRGEGTPFINADGSQSPYNDYDLIVIVDRLDKKSRSLIKQLESELSNELGITVDLHPYQLHELPLAEFSLLNYELKYGHKVIWGDPDILKMLPDYPHDQIPLHEGTRLLMNRGKLLLDLKIRLKDETPFDGDEQILYIKFLQKLWLALGDAALLLAGKYDLLYTVKKERAAELADGPEIAVIQKKYIEAVTLKESGEYLALTDFQFEEEFQKARNVFLEYFDWYRRQYRSNECSLLKAVLLNLRYHGRPLPRHPRLYLYDALAELLKESPDEERLRQTLFSNGDLLERFYWLRARFA